MHADTTLQQINLTVRQLIAESVRRPLEEVPFDALLDDSGLALDSLSLITLNVALEERYDITLPDFISDEARTVRSVRDVVALVAKRIAERANEGEPA
jgi:acyl carrier protein